MESAPQSTSEVVVRAAVGGVRQPRDSYLRLQERTFYSAMVWDRYVYIWYVGVAQDEMIPSSPEDPTQFLENSDVSFAAILRKLGKGHRRNFV